LPASAPSHQIESVNGETSGVATIVGIMSGKNAIMRLARAIVF
jgi:hypothetical protein